MASLGTDSNELGIAFRTRSSGAHLLSSQNATAVGGAMRGPLVRHGPMTTGAPAGVISESLQASQLALQLPSVPTQPAAAPVHKALAGLPASALPSLPPSLTPSQRGELELAKTRAERAAAGRTRLPAGGGSGATAVGSANPAWGAAGGGSKRPRGGGGGGDASMPNTDDDDSDGELELSRLSPEEQERVLTARLAGGGAGASDKDARRLKRLLRNRVSAQQARERKKQYVSSLEDQIREQQAHIGLLEKRLEDVESQNEALRNIIMTMRGFSDNPPAGGAAAAAGAAGGPTGRPPGAAAARPPTQARGRAAAAPHIQPQPAPQPQSPRGFRAGPGLLSGAALGGSAGCGGAQQQPQQPDQVVPELPPGQPDLDAPHGQEMQQEEGQAQQRQAPENRHSAPQRPPADAAPQYPAAPPGGGDGSGSSPSVGFAAVPSIPGLGAAAPRPALLTHGSDALRYPTPVLGQLPPDVLAGMEPGGMSYNQGFGAEDDDVPPDIEVPDCAGVDF